MVDITAILKALEPHMQEDGRNNVLLYGPTSRTVLGAVHKAYGGDAPINAIDVFARLGTIMQLDEVLAMGRAFFVVENPKSISVAVVGQLALAMQKQTCQCIFCAVDQAKFRSIACGVLLSRCELQFVCSS